MKRVNFYAVIRQMRKAIVKAMQERGITELPMFMSYREWGEKEGYKPEDFEDDEDDDEQYLDYKDTAAPYVIFFDKYNRGIDYRVDKVSLVKDVLQFECYENELGSETFGEDDLVFLTYYNVYDVMMDLLDIKEAPQEYWQIQCGLKDYDCTRVDVVCSEDDLDVICSALVRYDRKQRNRPVACTAYKGGGASFSRYPDHCYCDCM